MDFGLKLKEKRLDLRLSQEQLADSLGVTRQTIANWEKGKTYPDIGSVIKLSDLYDISLDELLKGDAGMKKHVEDTASFTDKLWNSLFVVAILLLPSSLLLTHWEWNNAGSVIKLLSMVLFLMILVFRWKISGGTASELWIGLFFWSLFFLTDVLYLFAPPNTLVNGFTFEYILLGIILLYSYGTCFKTKLAFLLTVTIYFGTPIFVAASTHLPAILENGLTQQQNIFGKHYRVEEIIYQGENAEIPSKITLGSDGKTLVIDQVTVGQFTRMESEKGDSWQTWEMIPSIDPIGRVTLSSLKPSGSAITLEYRIDLSTPESSKQSTLWSVKLSPARKINFSIKRDNGDETWSLDWYSTKLISKNPELWRSELHSCSAIDNKASGIISVDDDKVAELAVLEEYHCDDKVETYEYILTRDKRGVFPLPEDLVKRYEQGEQYAIYQIQCEDGVYFMQISYSN